jgi:hypothetical protein
VWTLAPEEAAADEDAQRRLSRIVVAKHIMVHGGDADFSTAVCVDPECPVPEVYVVRSIARGALVVRCSACGNECLRDAGSACKIIAARIADALLAAYPNLIARLSRNTGEGDAARA